MGWMINAFVKVTGDQGRLMDFKNDENRFKGALESASKVRKNELLWQWTSYSIYPKPLIEELANQYKELDFDVEIFSEELGYWGLIGFRKGRQTIDKQDLDWYGEKIDNYAFDSETSILGRYFKGRTLLKEFSII